MRITRVEWPKKEKFNSIKWIKSIKHQWFIWRRRVEFKAYKRRVAKALKQGVPGDIIVSYSPTGFADVKGFYKFCKDLNQAYIDKYTRCYAIDTFKVVDRAHSWCKDCKNYSYRLMGNHCKNLRMEKI